MKKISIILFVLFVSVVIFEFFLRYSPFSSGISPVRYDKDIGMWHIKDFESYLVKECYKNKYIFDKKGRVANSYDYDTSKRDIVLLGDSQIEALMVKNNKIIHNSLHREFNGKYNVLNYGLSGTGPAQQYQILENKVDLTNTHTILHFVFLENDLNDADPKNFTIANRPKVYMEFLDLENYKVVKPRTYDTKEKMRDFLGQFELYAYLKKTFYYYKTLLDEKPKPKNKDNVEKNFQLDNEEYKWKQLNGSVYQISQIAKNMSLDYKVIIYSADEFQDGYSKRTKQFQNFLVTNEIDNINIVPFLKKLSTDQKLGFECDSHWNGETHQELASHLAKLIEL